MNSLCHEGSFGIVQTKPNSPQERNLHQHRSQFCPVGPKGPRGGVGFKSYEGPRMLKATSPEFHSGRKRRTCYYIESWTSKLRMGRPDMVVATVWRPTAQRTLGSPLDLRILGQQGQEALLSNTLICREPRVGPIPLF